MSFRLVPNSVTLDDLERRNSPNRRVITTIVSWFTFYGTPCMTLNKAGSLFACAVIAP